MQPLNWLSVCELHQVTVGVAEHRKIPDYATCVSGWLDKYSQLSSSFGNLINLLSRVTLEAEVIHAGSDFSLPNDEQERRVLPRRSVRSEPNCSSSFSTPISDD